MSIPPYTLEEVLQPRSVAILGASRAPQKWGHVATKQLIAGGFAGDIYLINPSVSEILGRATYPSVREVPGPIDLAVIATAFPHVQQAVDDCIAHGVKGIVIITAGFSETGADGRLLEQQLVARCHEHGIRIIGSNCMGLYVRAVKTECVRYGLSTSGRTHRTDFTKREPGNVLVCAGKPGWFGFYNLLKHWQRYRCDLSRVYAVPGG